MRTKSVRAGDWRTVESFWNVTTTAFFLAPAGAEVKVRYGVGWFGVDRQRQQLDGVSVKRFVISIWSLSGARLQVRVQRDANVTYEVLPGNVARPSPEFHF